MRWPARAIDGAASRNQRLPDHLAAKDALPAHLRAAAAKQVLLERLKVEDREQGFDGGGHTAVPMRAQTRQTRRKSSVAGRDGLKQRDNSEYTKPAWPPCFRTPRISLCAVEP